MQLKLVENEPKYWEFIRNLRNDSEVKKGFVQQQYITTEKHKSFMESHNKYFYICLAEEKPAGYVGQIDNDIRVATSPEFQGKGIGKFMINALMEKHPNAFAKVKVENEVSLGLFESCGFKKQYYILEK